MFPRLAKSPPASPTPAAPAAVEVPAAPGVHEVLGEAEAAGHALVRHWLDAYAAGRPVAWVGRRVWQRVDGALWVAADQPKQRAWAAELCCKCPALAAVVVDGRGFDLRVTRRLQLACKDADTRLFVLRDAINRGQLSAAAHRWSLTPVPDTSDLPRRPTWRVELLRSKRRLDLADPLTPTTLTTLADFDTTHLTAHDDRRPAWTLVWHPSAGRAVAHEGAPEGNPPQLETFRPAWPSRGLPVGLPPDVAGRPAAAQAATVA